MILALSSGQKLIFATADFINDLRFINDLQY